MARREPFDQERAFVANRSFMWAGQRIRAGQPFEDRSNARRFRQLYDSRYTKMLPASIAPPRSEDDPDRPAFASMNEQELVLWMRERGVIPHPKTTHAGLIKKAGLLWAELKAGIVRPVVPAPGVEGHAIVVGGDRELRQEGSGQGLQEPVGQGPTSTRVRLNG